MKRFLKVLFIFLIGFIIMPTVFAESKAYFIEYPNGRVEATEDAAKVDEEILLYSGVTDKNGQVPLCDWASEGQLRIEQHVPDGYTTKERMMNVNLSDSSANFVNYRGGNPGTGRTFLFIVVIASVIAITIAARRNKKALLAIPVVAGVVLAGALTTAEAKNSCFNVTVRDGNGNALKGVAIDVYAKPIDRNEDYFVKFIANGGKFFDGTTEIYVPMPSATATLDEIWNSVSGQDYNRIMDNMWGAYRKGYYCDGYDDPGTVHSGDEIPLNWYQDSCADLYEVNGNGGYYDFYGKQLSSVFTNYQDSAGYMYSNFTRGGHYNIGLDEESSCSAFKDGVYSDFATIPEPILYGGKEVLDSKADHEKIAKDGSCTAAILKTYYVCWYEMPDGLYVNGVLFKGKPETCFFDSNAEFNGPGLMLYNYAENESFGLFYVDDQFIISPLRESSGKVYAQEVAQAGTFYNPVTKVNKMELIKNGNVILTLTSEDFTNFVNADIGLTSSEKFVSINNPEKAAILEDYLTNMDVEACMDFYESIGYSGGGLTPSQPVAEADIELFNNPVLNLR